MKISTLTAATFASLVATGVMANQDDRQKPQPGVTGDTQGSAMNENHQRDNTANLDQSGKPLEQKMKNEVQGDWREDAKERRDAELRKPEQH